MAAPGLSAAQVNPVAPVRAIRGVARACLGELQVIDHCGQVTPFMPVPVSG